MDDRPFYELDDEELILAEATEAALSDTQLPAPVPAEPAAEPGLVLCATIDRPAVDRLEQMAGQPGKFTLLDHALLVNLCACTTDRRGNDVYGLEQMFRHESGLLQLDRVAAAERPRSERGVDPGEVINIVSRSVPTDRAADPEKPARRLSASELVTLGSLAEEHNKFMAARRLGLALLPTLTRRDVTAEAFKEYTHSLRIFLNAVAARWQLMPWPELRSLCDGDADQAARNVIQAVRAEL